MSAYTPLYHGISVWDAQLLAMTVLELDEPVPEGTIRSWLSRYDLPRTADKQICPMQFREWLEAKKAREGQERQAEAV